MVIFQAPGQNPSGQGQMRPQTNMPPNQMNQGRKTIYIMLAWLGVLLIQK